MPWKIGEFALRNMNKIDEFAGHFNNVNFKYAKNIKGFDRNKIFVGHMQSMGFSNSFIQTVLSEEEEVNNQNTLAHDTTDLETLLNNNDLYKQKGKNLGEKSAQSLVVTPKNTTSRSNAPVVHPIKKFVNNSSSGGGDKNPPFEKIESFHKLPLRKKRKTLLENDIQSFSLEDMELEANIEKTFPGI
jgi:hypothetical protein